MYRRNTVRILTRCQLEVSAAVYTLDTLSPSPEYSFADMEQELRASDDENAAIAADGSTEMTSLDFVLLGVELEFQQ